MNFSANSAIFGRQRTHAQWENWLPASAKNARCVRSPANNRNFLCFSGANNAARLNILRVCVLQHDVCVMLLSARWFVWAERVRSRRRRRRTSAFDGLMLPRSRRCIINGGELHFGIFHSADTHHCLRYAQQEKHRSRRLFFTAHTVYGGITISKSIMLL